MGDNEYIPKEKDKVKTENDLPKGKPVNTDKKQTRTKEKKESPLNIKKNSDDTRFCLSFIGCIFICFLCLLLFYLENRSRCNSNYFCLRLYI